MCEVSGWGVAVVVVKSQERARVEHRDGLRGIFNAKVTCTRRVKAQPFCSLLLFSVSCTHAFCLTNMLLWVDYGMVWLWLRFYYMCNDILQ